MATIEKIVQRNAAGSVLLVQWIELGQGDDGDPVYMGEFGDRSIQVTGTFGGATLQWEGSNDGTNYVALSDPQGTDIAMTTAGISAVAEVTRMARPKVVGGGGTTDLDVSVLLRKSEPTRRVIEDSDLAAI